MNKLEIHCHHFLLNGGLIDGGVIDSFKEALKVLTTKVI